MVEGKVSFRVHWMALTQINSQFNFPRSCNTVPISWTGTEKFQFSEDGCRAGYITAKWKCQVLSGELGSQSLISTAMVLKPQQIITHKTSMDYILCMGAHLCLDWGWMRRPCLALYSAPGSASLGWGGCCLDGPRCHVGHPWCGSRKGWPVTGPR